MKRYVGLILILFLFTSCGAWPQALQTVEDIADDTAVKVEVSREAIQKDSDVTINVELKNSQMK
jgi:uncharacterized protein YcfL